MRFHLRNSFLGRLWERTKQIFQFGFVFFLIAVGLSIALHSVEDVFIKFMSDIATGESGRNFTLGCLILFWGGLRFRSFQKKCPYE